MGARNDAQNERRFEISRNSGTPNSKAAMVVMDEIAFTVKNLRPRSPGSSGFADGSLSAAGFIENNKTVSVADGRF